MIFDSLMAVFLVIALGYWLKRSVVPLDDQWRGLEKLAYFVLIPALILKTLAFANLKAVPFALMAGTLVAGNLLGCAILLLARHLLARHAGVDGPAFTSVFQGSMRWNAFVALALSGNLFGPQGLALSAVAVATLIPLLNIQSVLILKRFGSGSLGSIWHGLLTNPFLIATAAGIVLNVSGLPLPRVLVLSLDIVGQGAFAAGLLLVGVGLKLHDLKSPSPAMMIGVGFRLVAMPLMAAAIGMAFGLPSMALAVAVIATGVPSAPAAYVLARQMGGDAPLMAAILTAQTLISAITLPILLILFGGS